MTLQYVRKYLMVGVVLLLSVGCDRINDTWNYYKHGYKVQMGKISFFYKSPVTVDEVKSLGNYLNKGTNNDSDSISVKVLKNDEIYEVYFVVKKGMENDPSTIQVLKELGDELSREVFQYSKTDIHLTDETFGTLRVVPCLSCYRWVERRKRVKRDTSTE